MAEPALIILAAGMGSRYGGIKQIDPMGEHGEKIIDYSLYDAKKAGFRRAVFVIRKELEKDFEEEVYYRIKDLMEIETVMQEPDDIPKGVVFPEGRAKLWGTGHATLAGARILGDSPYCVINADDYYGDEAYNKIYDFLKTVPEDSSPLSCAMVGYTLKNTVTENGYVSRGVCEVKDGELLRITERTHIEKREDRIAFTEDGENWHPLEDDTIVSMNFWGFPAGFTEKLEVEYEKFFESAMPKDPQNAEFYLPFAVDSVLKNGDARVKVLSSQDKWYGVTHREDKEIVKRAFASLTKAGVYPSPLWGK